MENIILFFEKENGESPVFEFLCELPVKHRAKAYWEIELLKNHGKKLKEPYVKKVSGDKYEDLWELRIKFASDISRIIYFIPIDNTFIFLHGFVKKADKIPAKELEIAIKRKNEYERRQKDEKMGRD